MQAPIHPIGNEPDAVVALSSNSASLSPEIKRQFEGNPDNGQNPSDNTMAISDNGWIVSVVNSSISYYNEDGSIALNAENLSTFYSYLNFSDFFFNPRVLYDPVSDRFILATLNGKTPETSHLVISFSKSQNPGDGWWTYSFEDITEVTDTWMNDLQTGVSTEDLYVTGNLFNASDVLSKSIILQIDKGLGYAGQNLNYTYWTNIINESGQPTGSITPVSHGLDQGYSPGIYLLASRAGGGNSIQLFKIDNDSGNDPLLFNYSIPATFYSIGNNGAQLGSSKLLDVGDCRMQDAFFDDGLIHYVHHDQFTNGVNGIRYGKLDPATLNNTAQRYGLATNTYAYPVISPFSAGANISTTVLLGFCRSTNSRYPEYDVMTISEDFTASQPVVVKAGESPITASNTGIVPWGHYSGLSRRHNATIPTVWFSGSYGKNNRYGNWIAEVVPLGSGLNTPCEQAEGLFCGTSVIGSTSGNSQLLADCGGALGTAPGKWFRLVGTGTNVTVSTCSGITNFNTKIAVFSGSCSNLTCVTGADDAVCAVYPTSTTLTFYAIDGDEYFIYVTGAGGAFGAFELSATCSAVPGTCNGGQVLSNCSGTISDGSANNPYSNNLSCSWTISPAAASSMTLTFTSFNTEYNFDFVRVYNGTSTNGILLGTFSGDTIPTVLTASSGSMHLVFETDGSSTSSGWSANYACSTAQIPVANFIANQITGTAPHTVSFTNQSTNTPTAYLWDFGDGVTSTTTNPTHIYNSPGVYTVILTASNLAGSNTKTRTNYITVVSGTQTPVAAFNASNVCGQAPLTVNFTDQSTNSPTSWLWNFGNGQTSSQQNPAYTFTLPGTYTVQLTAGNVAGSDNELKTALITVLPPISITTLPSTTVCHGVPVTLQAAGASTYSWTGTGLNNTSGNPVIANPANPGNYNYSVIGTTNNCASAPVNVAVNFVAPPVVTLNASTTTACFGTAVSISAVGASSYAWSGAGLSGVTGSIVTALVQTPGTYAYTVTGSTNGCASAPAVISITFTAVPSVSLNVSTNNACIDSPVTLTATGASTYQWAGLGLLQTTGAQVTASPGLAGVYSYQVIGTVNGCQAAPQTVTVQFNNIPAITLNPALAVICEGESLQLTATGGATYTWTGPGLNGITVGTVTVSPSLGQTQYSVTGMANGCQSPPLSALVTVNPAPTITVTGNENPICLGDTVFLTAAGALQYEWSGPNLLSNSAAAISALPAQAGVFSYQVTGSNGTCISPATNVSVTVISLPLSVAITQTGCPGPNLTYTADVVNGAAFNNITWYLNGAAVWAGPSYTLINATNGNQIFCTAAPQNPPQCTQPAMATSNTIAVDCIPLSSGEVQGLGSMNIVPNPNNGLFQLEINTNESIPLDIRVFNTIGQLILQMPLAVSVGKQQYPMDLSAKPAGLYWLVVSSVNRKQTMQFIKE